MTADQTSLPRRGNPAGLVSLVFGILLLLANVAAQSLAPAIPVFLAKSGMSYQVIPLLFGIPQAVVAVIATALGIVGLLLRDRPRVPAIIGTTLGASHLISSVIGLLGAGIVGAALG